MSLYQVNEKIKDVFARMMEDDRVRAGLSFIESDQIRAIEDNKQMVQIAAPTFHEAERAADYAERLRALGLVDVHVDRHGNALGKRPGQGNGPTILIEAHLDTVFPLGTDLTPVEREGRIYAPGIGDDTRGLAANLSLVRALHQIGIETEGDIIVAGTVREEGQGGLHGIKTLLEDHPEVAASISIDGAGCDSIIYQGTGIRNLVVTYTGPGGHAYSAFGTPSPLHAAARAVAKISNIRPPVVPKTTFTVSLIEGGHQIHAIAQKAKFSINLRSDDPQALDELYQQVLTAMEAGAREENERWGKDVITMGYEIVLDDPAVVQPDDAEIVQVAWVATECIGVQPRLVPGGNTNASMPIMMGVPAVNLGRGGKEGGVHTLEEWFDPEGAYLAPQKSLLILLALAGLRGVTKPLL
ncbi:MAG: M20/M25/M40 family metallo-hydrolase [Bacillota bacterium]